VAEVAHVFTCDQAYEDDRGQPSVIGMFDHVRAAAFPFTQPRIVVAVQIAGHRHERCDLSVEVLDPQHHVVLSTDNEAPVLLSDIGQGFVTVTLTDTVFETPGRYTVRIMSEGRVAASKPLVVEHES